jgi:hypothetical protein
VKGEKGIYKKGKGFRASRPTGEYRWWRKMNRRRRGEGEEDAERGRETEAGLLSSNRTTF